MKILVNFCPVLSEFRWFLVLFTKTFDILSNSVTSLRRPKMKRDAGVSDVFFLSKKTAFTPASLFIFGRPTDVMALKLSMEIRSKVNFSTF